MASNMVFSGACTYSATKIMLSNFGEAVHYELKSNVDVTVWDAGHVATNIHMDPPPRLVTLSAKKAVSDILRQLGKERRTRGSVIFKI